MNWSTKDPQKSHLKMLNQLKEKTGRQLKQTKQQENNM